MSTKICDKIKIVLKQTKAALGGDDIMIWICLYAQFVHMMLAAQCGYLIYLWSVKWVIPDELPKINDRELYGSESWDFYKDYSLVTFLIALFLIPLFGYLSDRIDIGNQMVLTFGLRCVASLAYFVIDSPRGDIVLFTLVVLKTCNPLQATVLDSLFTKRLPGDVRA